MKILVLSQYYEPEPFLIHDKMREIIKIGHDVTVITSLPNYPNGEVLEGYQLGREIIDEVEVIRLPTRPRKKGAVNLFLNYMSFMRLATSYVQQLDASFDIVYVYQLSPVLMAVPGLKYKKKYKKPLIIYTLDLWPESLISGGIAKNSFIYNIFKLISKRIYKKADNIHVSSRQFPKYFNDVLNINKKFVYNPQYATLEGEKVTEVDTGFDQSKINITFTGNVGEMQGLDVVIKALAKLSSNELIFHVVGDGSKLDELKVLADDLKVKDKVVFHGRQPGEYMQTYMNQSDALMITMKKDEIISYTLPAKMLSYLQSGRMIIGSIDGESASIINDAEVGIVSPAEDVERLAQNFQQVIDNIDKMRDYGANGPKYYDQHFGKDRFIETLLNDMNRLVR